MSDKHFVEDWLPDWLVPFLVGCFTMGLIAILAGTQDCYEARRTITEMSDYATACSKQVEELSPWALQAIGIAAADLRFLDSLLVHADSGRARSTFLHRVSK